MKLSQKALMLFVIIGCASCSDNDASHSQAELSDPKPSPADGIGCPEGTIPNGESVPEIREAWCELHADEGVVQHGPYRSWYPDGTLGTKGQFDRGKPDGHWYGWHTNGAKQGEIIYDDGEIASLVYWNEDGVEVDSPEASRGE